MRCRPVELGLDDLVGDLGLEPRHLERRPVGRLAARLDGELGGEAPGLVLVGGKLVREVGLLAEDAAGSTRAAVQNQLPMCDSTASE